MKLAIRPIQGEFCAEVIGADLSRPVDAATFAQIERAWTRHSILVFRDVHMAPEQQIAFTRRFRSEEHTSELESHSDLVCRLLLEKKKTSSFFSRDRFHLQ